MDSATALRHDALTTAYEDTRLLIYRICHTLAFAYQTKFEDLITEAHYIFVRYFDKYDPSKGMKLSSYIHFNVRTDLITYLERNKRHQGHLEINEEVVGSCDANVFATEFLDTAEGDAAVVARLVLDMPQELQLLLLRHDDFSRRSYLSFLKRHLNELGWSAGRISDAFAEITMLLSPSKPQVVDMELEEEVEPDPDLRRLGLTKDRVRCCLK